MKRLLLITFALLLLGVGANAQMPVRNPAWVHIGPPWYEGTEAFYSSNTLDVFNYYGNYWAEVKAGAPGVGLWEAANNYRAGGADIEPIAAHDGEPVMIQDATATFYMAFFHDGTDNIADSNLGNWLFFSTGAGNRMQVYNPGQVPAAPGNNYAFVQHDAADATFGSAAGDVLLAPATGFVGIGTAAPTTAFHVVGSIRMVDGTQAAGRVLTDDGTGTGVGTWVTPVDATVGSGFFGDGSDGNVTLAINTTLTRDMFYNDLTINGGVTLYPNGFKVFVKGTLTINGAISVAGGNGGNGGNGGIPSVWSGGTAGAAAASVSSGGSICGGVTGAAGGLGGNGSLAVGNGSPGGNGTAGIGVVPGFGSNGVVSGTAGAGGNAAARTGGAAGAVGAGGTVTAAAASDGGFRDIYHLTIWRTFPAAGSASFMYYDAGSGSAPGGGGGASNDGARSGGGGGGGGGAGASGGAMYIAAYIIVNNGTVTAGGGNGGNGGNGGPGQAGGGATGGGGGGAGGAAGNGGVIVLIYTDLSGAGVTNVTGGTGGALGTGGAGQGGGNNGGDGVAGSNGTVGLLLTYPLAA